MAFTRREFVRGGVAAFTVGFAAPAFLSDLARAQGRVAAQPRGALSERRQRRAQHARSLHRSAVLRPSSDARHPARRTSCRSAPTERRQRPRPESTADRAAERSSTPGAWRSSSAPGIPTRAGRTSRAPTSGPPAIRASPQGTGWLGRYLDTLPSPGRSADGVVHGARDAADAAGADGRRAVDSQRAAAMRSRARTTADRRRVRARAARCASRRTCRSTSRTWRS